MFYVLNFADHSFVSCDDRKAVAAVMEELTESGVDLDSIEIINGFLDDCRIAGEDVEKYMDTVLGE